MTDRADQVARDRIHGDLDASLFIEAGAGTGKTTEVVGRIVELVAAGEVTIDQVVAITFTEAAAAELRARVRDRLEEAARAEVGGDERGRRCGEAARAVDQAAIDTIHAFAAYLLRTFPFEAGVPPGFETMDEIEQDLDFRERFRNWFEASAGDPAAAEPLRRCLLLELKPDQLSAVARQLQEQYDLLRPYAAWPAPAPASAIAAANRLGAELSELVGWLDLGPAQDPLRTAVDRSRYTAERLSAARTESEALTGLMAGARIWIPQGGKAADWGRLPDGRNAGTSIRAGLRVIKDGAWATLAEHRRAALSEVAVLLRDFTLTSAAERRRTGRASFHDLLVWARDLLRDSTEVRSLAARRWRRVFIDEFQDTDPLQAELAFHLCAAEGGPMPADWRDVPLTPGKLCVVGDPKQSIYRFRRADIGVYQAVGDRVGERVDLNQNFRSVPRILDWVNSHFAGVMHEDAGVQAEYARLQADAGDSGTGLHIFGAEMEARQPEVWQAEADAVASLARLILEEGWTVSEGTGADRHERRARASDICVLIPTRTNLRRLERAFDQEHVEYRVESGDLVVMTQEVRELVSCLRAIEDPTDQVAIVAALRSPAYGCSDVDLLRWREGGGRFRHTSIADLGGPVRNALEDLSRLHHQRHSLDVAALVERFVDERMLVAAAFGEPRPREVWRRYRYVVGRARAFAATRRRTLRAFVEWMEGLEREQARDVAGSMTEADEEAVRVMTVHSAKGLEFPVVIMTGWGSRPNLRNPEVLANRAAGRVEIGIGALVDGERPWSTGGFAGADEIEKRLAQAESRRLLYVAATRARDHLLVSLFRGSHFADETMAAEMAVSLAGHVPEPARLEIPPPAETAAAAPELELAVAGAGEAQEAEWVAARAERLGRLGALPLATATGLAHVVGEEERPEEAVRDIAAFRRGRGGTARGRAVHAVLQVADLAGGGDLTALCQAQAAAEGILPEAGRIEQLARVVLSSEPVRRALASGRYWREVPVGAPVDGMILEGFVDLLYEDEGGLVVIDYKTDDVSPGEIPARMEQYRIQGQAYARLVPAATARPVRWVDFVFAAPGVVERVETSA